MAAGAHDVYVFGDFNNWQRTEIRMRATRTVYGAPSSRRRCTATGLATGSLYKLHVHGDNGWKDRIPAYATRVVQDEVTKNYTAQFWGAGSRSTGRATRSTPRRTAAS